MIISIPIPDKSKCLIKIGDKVNFDTPFYEQSSSKSVTIEVSKRLNISSSTIFHHLKKLVGDSIKKGEVLAAKKGFLTTIKIISEFDGIIKEIDHNKGICVLSVEEQKYSKTTAFFKGEAHNIDSHTIQIKVKSGKEFPLKKSDESFGGKTLYLDKNNEQTINSDCDNHVCISESITLYAQTKTEALGINGFITLSSLPNSTSLPFSQIKNIEDMKKIFQYAFPYCIILKEKSTIIFYE